MKQNTKDEEEIFENTEGLDTLTSDEKQKIQQEIQEIFVRKQEHDKNSLLFDMSGVSSGVKLPVLFNLVLIGVMIIVILITVLLVNNKDKSFITGGRDLIKREGALAQEIIAQNQDILDTQAIELEAIQSELNTLLNDRSSLSDAFDVQVDVFETNLNSDLKKKQATLRKNLEAKNFAEKEILRRLEQQKIELRDIHSEKLVSFIKEQEIEKNKREKEFTEQIAALQIVQNTKRSEIEELQNEVARQKIELANQTTLINNQLSNAQNTLKVLQTEKEAKINAFKEINLYHQNIISLLNRGDFQGAKLAMSKSNAFIKASPYSNDVEAKPYIEAFNTYSKLINTNILAQQKLEITKNTPVGNTALSGENIDVLNSRIETLEKENVQFVKAGISDANQIRSKNTEIKTLKKKNVQLVKDGASTTNQIGSKNAEIETLKKENVQLVKAGASAANQIRRKNTEFAKLQNDYEKIRKEYDVILREVKLNNTDGSNTGFSEQKIQNILENIKLITTYLSLKNNGVSDSEMKSVIETLVEEQTIYEEIIQSIALSIDTTGRLQF